MTPRNRCHVLLTPAQHPLGARREFRNALGSRCHRLAGGDLLSDNRVAHCFYRIDLLESVNWTWGLSLIALTIAIHAAGAVVMAFAGFAIRARMETRKFGLRHLLPIVIGIIG